MISKLVVISLVWHESWALSPSPTFVANRAASLSLDVLGLTNQLTADAIAAPRRAPKRGSPEESGKSARGDEVEEYWKSVWAERGPQLRTALERGGPTYIKFGQALASRSDLVGEALAAQLRPLQDGLKPFCSDEARRIISRELPGVLASEGGDLQLDLEHPVAAASVAQVYKGTYRGRSVAVKVQRPGLADLVGSDAVMLRSAARTLSPLVKADLEGAVDEFLSRLFEELDFKKERGNLEKFAALYDAQRGAAAAGRPFEYSPALASPAAVRPLPAPGVRVPACYQSLCSESVLGMEWIEGEKLLVTGQDAAGAAEDLALLQLAIECTLSQLLDTGVMHADPHGGNLLKVKMPKIPDQPQTQQQRRFGLGRLLQRAKPKPVPSYQLAYLDFGLVSEIPESVRDSLVAAVVLLVDRKFDAVAELFGELMLLPQEVLDDPRQRAEFSEALAELADAVLTNPAVDDQVSATSGEGEGSSTLPKLRFEALVGALLGFAPRFAFQLPPYFLNNARALGTLEGMALQVDPDFSVLQAVYPFALRRLLANPSGSDRLQKTLDGLVYGEASQSESTAAAKAGLSESAGGPSQPLSQPSPSGSGRAIRWRELRRLWVTAAREAKVPKREILREVLSSEPGRRFAARLAAEQCLLWARRPHKAFAKFELPGEADLEVQREVLVAMAKRCVPKARSKSQPQAAEGREPRQAGSTPQIPT